MECSICVEKYNHTSRMKISCVHCDLEVCRRCVETYLTDEEKNYDMPLHCMNCKLSWTEEFITTHLCRKALEALDFKKARFMFTQQLSMLSDIKHLMEYEQQMLNKVVPKLQELTSSIEGLQNMVRSSSTRCPELTAKIQEEKKTKKELSQHYQNWKKHHLMTYFQIIPEDIQHRVDLIGISMNDDQVIGNTNGFRDQIVSKCPKQECEGYIIYRSFKCVICETTLCRSCHQMTDPKHICETVNVDSVSFINQTTKKCPNCFTSIQKTDGCNQMWCTRCKHGFEWSSGKAIKNRALHNPEYFQWVEVEMNRQGERGSNPIPKALLMQQHCTGLPEYQHLIRHMRIVYESALNVDRINVSDIQSVANLYNFRIKLEQTYTQRFPVYSDKSSPKTHFDLTKKWLRNEISQDHVIEELNKRNKKQRINKRIVDNFKTFETLCNDLFHKQLHVNDFNISIVDELHPLIEFTNANFIDIQRVFKCTVPNIMEDWDTYFGPQYQLHTVIYQGSKRRRIG